MNGQKDYQLTLSGYQLAALEAIVTDEWRDYMNYKRKDLDEGKKVTPSVQRKLDVFNDLLSAMSKAEEVWVPGCDEEGE